MGSSGGSLLKSMAARGLRLCGCWVVKGLATGYSKRLGRYELAVGEHGDFGLDVLVNDEPIANEMKHITIAPDGRKKKNLRQVSRAVCLYRAWGPKAWGMGP